MAETVPELNVDDVDASEVWSRLQEAPDSVLIDVRTRAEWEFVGLPDLAQIGKEPLLLEWQTFPDGQLNASFADRLASKLEAIGATHDTDRFFICRSGARSLSAAKALAAMGYRACHNVAGGFEGPRDSGGRRGTVSGWKADGLPWVQR